MPAAASTSSSRHAPAVGPYAAQDRPCRSSTPDFKGLPIGPMPGALSSVQPSSMTLTDSATRRPAGQPEGSVMDPRPASGFLEPEQPRGVAAEDGRHLLVRQRVRCKDVVDRM